MLTIVNVLHIYKVIITFRIIKKINIKKIHHKKYVLRSKAVAYLFYILIFAFLLISRIYSLFICVMW